MEALIGRQQDFVYGGGGGGGMGGIAPLENLCPPWGFQPLKSDCCSLCALPLPNVFWSPFAPPWEFAKNLNGRYEILYIDDSRLTAFSGV